MGVEIVKTEEAKESGIKYLNINVSNSEVERNPDRVRLCADAGILEYVKSKTGHWIEKDGFDGDVYYDCSECGESWTTIEGTPWDNEWNYCPNCGCRMVEPQESEE